MKVKENVTLYICEHCNKKYQSKKWCVKHENTCHENPINARPCFECGYCVNESKSVWLQDHNGNDLNVLRDVFICSESNEGLVPPKCERTENYKNHGGYNIDGIEINEPMPITCKNFNNRYV